MRSAWYRDDRGVGADGAKTRCLLLIGGISFTYQVDKWSLGCRQCIPKVGLNSSSVVAERGGKAAQRCSEAARQLGRCQSSISKDRLGVPASEKCSSLGEAFPEGAVGVKGGLKRGGESLVSVPSGLAGPNFCDPEVSRKSDDVGKPTRMSSPIPHCEPSPEGVSDKVSAKGKLVEIAEQGAMVGSYAWSRAMSRTVEKVGLAITGPKWSKGGHETVPTLGEAVQHDKVFVPRTDNAEPRDSLWDGSDGV